ncbi:hypothetical protein [uncultured Sharpea sp.]|uniref:hypothetical protein n=1 Tax=uncultured Sharpea sp. TaxID=1112738 RepID=UPI00258E8229|nr:hypothetical protein [uncultured Sharpea sp.]
MKEKLKYIIPVVIIALMVGAAIIFHDQEILFPEIAAIAIGALVSPQLSWKTSRIRILITIMVAAICGMLIVAYVHLPVTYEMVLAYFIGQILLLSSETTFAPMISAIVLPVMLQTRSINYLISAFVFTSLILVVHYFFEKKGLVEVKPVVFSSMWNKEKITIMLARTLLAFIGIVLAFRFDFKFAVAPPLLVAFTEFTNPQGKVRKKPMQAILLIFVCALVASYSRYMLAMQLKMSLIIPVCVTSIFVIFMIATTKMYIPPAGAIGILAFLIPEDAVIYYPLHVFVGIAMMMLLALVFFREEKIYAYKKEVKA